VRPGTRALGSEVSLTRLMLSLSEACEGGRSRAHGREPGAVGFVGVERSRGRWRWGSMAVEGSMGLVGVKRPKGRVDGGGWGPWVPWVPKSRCCRGLEG
jgi:hypothetical protein